MDSAKPCSHETGADAWLVGQGSRADRFTSIIGVRGVHAADQLISLCAACHARIHRLGALRQWLPEFAVELWAEQHPEMPVQLQFPAAVMKPSLAARG